MAAAETLEIVSPIRLCLRGSNFILQRIRDRGLNFPRISGSSVHSHSDFGFLGALGALGSRVPRGPQELSFALLCLALLSRVIFALLCIAFHCIALLCSAFLCSALRYLSLLCFA